MKPNGRKRQVEERQEAPEDKTTFETDRLLWGVLLKMQKDQREFYNFDMDHHIGQERMFVLNHGENLEDPYFFPYHILGELIHEEDQDGQE